MDESVRAVMKEWESFYVIVGSSCAALIGLQFVVMTLVAGLRRPAEVDSIEAFASPTVLQLAGALLVSAIMSAPWTSWLPVSIAIGICGFGGLAYGGMGVFRARKQTYYAPVMEDWVWYNVLPCIAHLSLGIAAILLSTTTTVALFVIGSAALGQLFIGIRNAWDSATYIVVSSTHGESEQAAPVETTDAVDN